MGDPVRLEEQRLKPIPTPDELWRLTGEMQSEAAYRGLGFRKAKLPPELFERFREQFRGSVPRFRAEGDVDFIRSEEDGTIPALYWEDRAFNEWVLEALKPMHEAWCGVSLLPSACYGFRVYQRGSYLYNHVDRTSTHIISSTLCIDRKLDQPWPLYIEDIEGNAFVVDMEPGEFVFYEGASLVHGRPWPLDGDWYAGMFVHYRPAGEEAA